MDDLTRLIAIEDIKQLKYRYYRFLDAKDWISFKSLWAPNAEMSIAQEGRILQNEDGIYRGPEAITEFACRAIGAGRTIDHAIMPEIEILSGTEATAIWVQEDRVSWPEGQPNRHLHGHGHEYETYVKIDGKWLIKSTRLARMTVDIVRNTDYNPAR
jgi:hypothetical protein